MSWQFDNNTPIYLQLVNRLQIMIASGIYPAGCKMPAVRELAIEAGVNPNTVQRAMGELERLGLLHAERTSGRFVTENQELLTKMKLELSSQSIRELFEQLEKLGLSKEEIVHAVKQYAAQEG